VFERAIPQPDGGARESLATYTPHLVDGAVQGFFVHVADVTPLKTLERQLETALQAVRTLHGLLPICMHCKKIRDVHGTWTVLETYLKARTDADFTHGICPQCLQKHYP